MARVLSSPYHFKEFLSSFAWQDMRNELHELRRNVLENMAKETNLDEVLRYQGRAEVLDDIIIMPEKMLEALEAHEITDEPDEPED